jgi:hypothetical protein
MSAKKTKRELVGPWRNLHGAVWLIGLAILAWQGWWWPGILVLVALSMLLEGVLMLYVPTAFEPSAPPPAAQTPVASPPVPEPPGGQHPIERLPSTCARCGGPIRGHEVKWTGPLSADCPYCGANLELAKE